MGDIVEPPVAAPLSLRPSGSDLLFAWPADNPSAALHIPPWTFRAGCRATVVPEGGNNTVTPTMDQEYFRLQ